MPPFFTTNNVSLLAYRGRTVQIAFTTLSASGDLWVRLDDIHLETRAVEDAEFDVYFGTNPQPGAAEYRGRTASQFWDLPTLQPLTTYYWQVVARRDEAAVPGPVWRFTTRRDVTNPAPRIATSTVPIVIPDFTDDGSADPYPSTLTVSNAFGRIARARVTLHRLRHSYPEDLDVMLVSPQGVRVLLMSDAGGAVPINGVTLTFDASALAPLPANGPLTSGVWRPANYAGYGDEFPPPAPGGSSFSGLGDLFNHEPNGRWSLYVMDNFSFEDGGIIAGGWSLELTLFYGDSDGDGMPDDYELTHRFNPLNGADALADADGDVDSNLHEYLAGTDPRDGGSVLRIFNFYVDGPDLVLNFNTGTGHRYRVERMNDVNTVSGVVEEFPGRAETVSARDPGGALRPRQFYRVRVLPE